jgi:quercetin dioxygenase-like cupin family protein
MTAFGTIDQIDHLRIWDGITAQAIEGERSTLAVIELEPNSTVQEHHHDNEQLGVLVRGTMTFRIGDDTRELTAGATWCIPSHVPHQVTAGPDGALAVECFTPVRADWAGLERVAGRPAPRLA